MKTSDESAKNFLLDVFTLSQRLCANPINGKLAYATTENFLGRVVDGYVSGVTDICLMENSAAYALCEVQNDLNKQQLGLYIYDAYRPWRAVKDFYRWFTSPVANAYELERKAIHYPHLEKNTLAEQGYVAGEVSRHNFGHAIDLVLMNLNNFQLLDMGAVFDYFDERSHITVTEKEIGKEAFMHRAILSESMQNRGFLPYKNEFWHFDYFMQAVDKPMDIVIESGLRGLNV